MVTLLGATPILSPSDFGTMEFAGSTSACRVEGMPNEVRCGFVRQHLDPENPNSPQIEVHYLVVPAMARNKQLDPVLMLAGGPGQSAISLASAVMSRFSRLNNRRDIVFIDQRGTGKSAPLQCADESNLPMDQALDPAAQIARIAKCRTQLQQMPYGDLRFFTTTAAIADFEAVRRAIGAPQWNLVGASYGTRVALEYMRLHPAVVRRSVLDGVAPPDAVLPASMALDTRSAFEAMLKSCSTEGTDKVCLSSYPNLRAEWNSLLASMPKRVTVDNPLTGIQESFELTSSMLLQLVRSPLYVPAMSAGLPAAIHAASTKGSFEELIGLSGSLGTGKKSSRLAFGMHFSVICSEDMPRLPKIAGSVADYKLYTDVCASWPRGNVPDAFYSVGPAQSPVLLLSGGVDPATPPRHAQRIQSALAAVNPNIAQQITVAHAAHGIMSISCIRDVVYRFIDAREDDKALPQDASCAMNIPRPGVFIPVRTETTGIEIRRSSGE